MGFSSRAEVRRHREEELEIVNRGGLELLLKKESKLLQEAHEKGVSPAVRAYTGGKSSNRAYYYKALTKLINLQAEMPNAKKWLDRKYKSAEVTEREFERIGLCPSQLATTRQFDLLFAVFYHKSRRRDIRPPSIKHREKELGIIEKDLSLLAELSPEDSELIQRVHGLGDYDKERSITKAVERVAGSKNTGRYFTAMTKLVWLQAKRKLYEPYKSEKAAILELEKANMTKKGSKRLRLLSPAKLATLCKWDLLYASLYYGLYDEPKGPRKSKYEQFEERVIEYAKGITSSALLKREKPGLYSSIHRYIGLANCTYLLKLFFECLEKRGMPAEAAAREIKGADYVLNKHYDGKYDNLVNEWKPHFEKIGNGIAKATGIKKETIVELAKAWG